MLNIIIAKIQKRIFTKKWRLLNSENQTIPGEIFPIDKVKVGKKSYGTINIQEFGHADEKLIIGNFVSIAENVKFILGGNHRIDTLTNYPLYSKYILNSPLHDANTKGPIIVKDEVWIGCEVIILSGSTLGKGCIIAAGSVVTKDVPDYAIVAGNPAKVLRFRFEKEIVESLLKIDLSKIPNNFFIDNIEEFYKPLNENLELIAKISCILENIDSDL